MGMCSKEKSSRGSMSSGVGVFTTGINFHPESQNLVPGTCFCEKIPRKRCGKPSLVFGGKLHERAGCSEGEVREICYGQKSFLIIRCLGNCPASLSRQIPDHVIACESIDQSFKFRHIRYSVSKM